MENITMCMYMFSYDGTGTTIQNEYNKENKGKII